MCKQTSQIWNVNNKSVLKGASRQNKYEMSTQSEGKFDKLFKSNQSK